ncbi:MAG: hypothetical protein ACXACW_14755 [Candidatus Hodarchaeales archaeon]|jgi:hypothetical protein
MKHKHVWKNNVLIDQYTCEICHYFITKNDLFDKMLEEEHYIACLNRIADNRGIKCEEGGWVWR